MTLVPRSPIAVVGVSALFPGSLDVTGFWTDIMEGTDLISDVPASHWLVEDYYDPDPSVPDKTYVKRGAFLKDAGFDAITWGIPPNIIPETDTSQLLALIVAQKVLDDASVGQDADRSRTSVILGVTSAQELMGTMVSRLQRPVWQKSLREAGLPETEVQSICDRISSEYNDWNESTFPGLLGNVVAGRIANRLNLGGTNCVTDAACASTFSALSMGVNELQLGDSDMVIAGGVDTMNDIFMFMCFSKTPALSPTGDCRPFSDQADGTMLGEGLGMVALKRLADAERDGDKIYAVINGVGSSSDGRSKSVYAPVSEGQANALQRAYAVAGYGPDSVELVEAHGTGTIAGDAAEIGGLRIAFDATGRQDRQWCAVGSVKSQIGHTKAAAGAAGLVKTIMALNHKTLPPTIKVETPSAELELESSPFHLATRARPWVRDSRHPRRGSVSSFGFGGSNFHIALSEYLGEGRAPMLRSLDSELIAICGASSDAVLETARGHIVHASKDGYVPWLAHATQSAFKPDAPCRLALVVQDGDDLAAKLSQAVDKISANPEQPFSTPSGIHYGLGARDGDMAFLFSGQGSQYIDMGGSVAMAFEGAIDPWDAAADIALASDWDNRLHKVVFPPTAFTDVDRAGQAALLSATEWAQPAIGTVSMSMLSLLDRLGLEADCFGGHSFGEITALAAAGVISRTDFLAVARQRGTLMRDAAQIDGAMTAASGTIEQLSKLLAGWSTDVVVANHNHPQQVVLSGSTDAISDVEVKLQEEGISTTRLPVATAFHSPIVADAATEFGKYLRSVDFSKGDKPVYSNTSGAKHKTKVRDVVAKQLANPVLFVDMIEAMYTAGVRTFVEVGPGSIQTGLVGRILGERSHVAVALDRKGKPGVSAFLGGLATLAAAGHALSFDALWAGYSHPDNPLERVEPKLSIPINGSNYGKPYPPAGGAADLPAPNPPRVSAPVAGPQPEPVIASVAPLAVPPVPNSPSVNASAMAETHRQTAEAHAAYMKLMAETHTAFLDTMERGLSLASGTTAVTPEPATPHMVSTPSVGAVVEPAIMEPLPVMAPPVDAIPVGTPVAAPVPAAPVPAPTPTPAPVPVIAGPSFDGLVLVMTGVVSEKTGYPAEMLEMGMDLEGDLGIDSIKRVEILSAVSELEPSLPELDTAVLADLRTLGDVVDYLASTLGDVGVPAADPAASNGVVAPPAVPSAPVIAGPSFDGLVLVMTGVVSEKTGYPAEMLEMGMDLEGDLGIDSIKRVEILSAVSELEPSLPELDTAVLADLRTLGDVVDYLASTLGDVGVPAAVPLASSGVATPPAIPVVASAPAVGAPEDLFGLVTDIVAEKTGYPPEMLESDTDLESDLGIDSIKRVEILSSVSDRRPEFAKLDTGVLADLRTLGDVVEYLSSTLAAPVPAVSLAAAQPPISPNGAPPASAPVTSAPDDLFGLVTDIVAEKTGYPPEMLESDTDLESDLGIDSIKRVEILSSVSDRRPEFAKLDTGVLADLRTLGDVVEYLSSTLAPAESAGSTATNGAAQPIEDSLFPMMTGIISEKTGYPPEMLEADTDLESDLGIDSIKRVEILSSVSDRRPDLGKLDTAVLADLRTIGDVVDYLRTKEPTGSLVHASSSAAATDGPNVGRYVLRRVEQPASGMAIPNIGGPFVISAGDLQSDLIAAFAQASISATALNVHDVPEGTRGLILLGSDSHHQDFEIAKAVVPLLESGVVVTVQHTGGTFGSESLDEAWIGGLAGLARTINQEYPDLAVKAIDTNRTDASVAIVEELLTGGPELNVGLPEDGRRIVLSDATIAARPGKPVLVDGDLVVASGGARGVTAATLINLAGTARLNFLLLGRTAFVDEPACCEGISDDAGLKSALLADANQNGQKLTPMELGKSVSAILAGREIRATLAAIAAHGSHGRYVPVDVTSPEDVATALASARQEFGPVAALVHGAGVIADKALADKTTEQFDRVFDTKVSGLRTLLQATAEDQLKVLALFSSVAARTGNVGQCDYAMANEVLNKVAVAEAARRPGCIVKSFGWGPWEGGMVNPALAARFAELGVPMIPLDVGARMFTEELTDSAPGEIELVIGGRPHDGPLLSENARSIAMEILTGPESHPQIVDHSIDGVPVVPVVMALEWFVRAAKAFMPGKVVTRLLDLEVVRGIMLEKDARLSITAEELDEQRVALAISLDGSLRYRCVAELADSFASAPSATHIDGLGSWGDTVVYDPRVLFHGPRFQMITTVDGLGETGLVATLQPLSAMGWPEESWQTDPSILDGGLQGAVLWNDRNLGGASLPTRIAEVRMFSEGPASGEVSCQVAAKGSQGRKSIADVTFVSNGLVTTKFIGLETHLRTAPATTSA